MEWYIDLFKIQMSSDNHLTQCWQIIWQNEVQNEKIQCIRCPVSLYSLRHYKLYFLAVLFSQCTKRIDVKTRMADGLKKLQIQQKYVPGNCLYIAAFTRAITIKCEDHHHKKQTDMVVRNHKIK